MATALFVGCDDGPPYFIPGTATLPDCQEPPAFNLDASEWSDTGTVTITSSGCADTEVGQELISCALTWAMSQSGSDIEILVDEEYTILGRLCGADLYLEGGWWLPVQDEGVCTYDDDSADEVGIQMGGNRLTVANAPSSELLEATGTLLLRGSCEASYEMVLRRFR